MRLLNKSYEFAYPGYFDIAVPSEYQIPKKQICVKYAYDYIPSYLEYTNLHTKYLIGYKNNDEYYLKHFHNIFLYYLRSTHPTARCERICELITKNLSAIEESNASNSFSNLERGILYINKFSQEPMGFQKNISHKDSWYCLKFEFNSLTKNSIEIFIEPLQKVDSHEAIGITSESFDSSMIGPIFVGLIDYQNKIIYPSPIRSKDSIIRKTLGVELEKNENIILTCVPSSYSKHDGCTSGTHKSIEYLSKTYGYLDGSKLLKRHKTIPKSHWSNRDRNDINLHLDSIAFNEKLYSRLVKKNKKKIILLDDIVTSGTSILSCSIIVNRYTQNYPDNYFAFARTYNKNNFDDNVRAYLTGDKYGE